ncbi:glycosyltransferase [Thioalkalivibrio sp. ALJ3]|uniref:glycosyltransferase n=1 Tax=Thioalkalivibrio sp. ALJ3 TaxID=1240557 RepID=UPI000378F5EA|nr:glycosyltransferase [Thioalkalivibrio sp. ALJ3]
MDYTVFAPLHSIGRRVLVIRYTALTEGNQLGISVLMAVHASDATDLLDAAIASITVEQTRKPDQLVLVKDGPLPVKHSQVVDRWQSRLGQGLEVVSLHESSGLGGALNTGLQRCQYPLVARMDADDLAFPVRLERQGAFMEKNLDIALVGSSAQELDLEGNPGPLRRVAEEHDALVGRLWACPFIHPSVMFRRDLIRGVGGYDASLRRRQDYELWFRVAQAGGRFANIGEPLIWYRFNRDTHKKQSTLAAWRQGVIGFRGSRKVGLPVWKQVACFAPFFRSLLPLWAQHGVYRLSSPFDPRR